MLCRLRPMQLCLDGGEREREGEKAEVRKGEREREKEGKKERESGENEGKREREEERAHCVRLSVVHIVQYSVVPSCTYNMYIVSNVPALKQICYLYIHCTCTLIETASQCCLSAWHIVGIPRSWCIWLSVKNKYTRPV